MNQRRIQITVSLMLLSLLASAGGFLHYLHLRQCHATPMSACNGKHSPCSPADDGSPRHDSQTCSICYNLVLTKALQADLGGSLVIAFVELLPEVLPDSAAIPACDISLSLFARPPPVV